MPKYRNTADQSVSVLLKGKKGEEPKFEDIRGGETSKNITINEDAPANRGLLHAGVLVVATEANATATGKDFA